MTGISPQMSAKVLDYWKSENEKKTLPEDNVSLFALKKNVKIGCKRNQAVKRVGWECVVGVNRPDTLKKIRFECTCKI